jgi:hypothetical protein
MVFVRTVGGGEFQGRMIASAADRLELVDGEGRIVPIYRESVASIRPIDTEAESESALFYRDAASNRLIVMPTAFPIEPGELHITNQELVIVTMSYGVTPRVSAWGGISLPGAIGNLRWSVSPLDRLALSFGTFAGRIWNEPWSTLVLPYALVSFGVPDRNTTAAVAVSLVDSHETSPFVGGALFALGRKAIVSRTAAVVVEAWFFLDSDGGRWKDVSLAAVPAAVFRIAGGRLSWDIGAFLPMHFASFDTGEALTGFATGSFIPLPILSLTYRLQ